MAAQLQTLNLRGNNRVTDVGWAALDEAAKERTEREMEEAAKAVSNMSAEDRDAALAILFKKVKMSMAELQSSYVLQYRFQSRRVPPCAVSGTV